MATSTEQCHDSRNREEEVEFRICDIHAPDPAALLMQLFGERRLKGRVIDRSSNGEVRFLAIEVPGASLPVVVDASRVVTPKCGSSPLHEATTPRSAMPAASDT